MAGDKGVSYPMMGDLLSYSLQSIDSILCKSFHAHHPVHLLPRSLSIHGINIDWQEPFTVVFLSHSVALWLHVMFMRKRSVPLVQTVLKIVF